MRVVICSDKGGVQKTSTSVHIIHAIERARGQRVRVVEIERSERKLTSVLERWDPERRPDVSVVLPSETALSEDPRLQAKTFAPVLAQIAKKEDLVLDLAAGAARGLFEAAEQAEHGDLTDGGEGVVFICVAKAEDAESRKSAEAAAIKARAIYPKATLIGVITNVVGDNGANVASALAKSVDRVLIISAEHTPLTGKLYGENHLPFHIISALHPQDIAEMLGANGSEQPSVEEAAMYRGRFRKWFRETQENVCLTLGLTTEASMGSGTPRPTKAAAGGR